MRCNVSFLSELFLYGKSALESAKLTTKENYLGGRQKSRLLRFFSTSRRTTVWKLLSCIIFVFGKAEMSMDYYVFFIQMSTITLSMQ